MNSRAPIVPLLFLTLIAAASPLMAQTPAPATTPAPAVGEKPGETASPSTTDASRTYVPADFARFAPQTALDMLNRVPGFTIKSESGERGLGQATGNVLVNGQRSSGKSNDVVTALSRISAKNVERIEIVDAATLEIQGLTGQVANVIVLSKGISGQYAYRPEFRAYNADPLFTRFEVSVGGTLGPVEYTVGLDNRASRSGADGPTWLYSPDGALIEDRNEQWRGNAEQPRLSGRFVYDGPGTAVGNLNLSYGRLYYDYLETGSRDRVGAVGRDRTVTTDETGYNYELGGDYEMAIGAGRLKLIGVSRGSAYPNETNVITRYENGSPATGSRSTSDYEDKEHIARSEYRWTNRGAEWQISAEGAFNSLVNASRVFTLTSDGRYDEIPLPGGTASVEEDRYEMMGSYGRTLSPRLTMKLSAGGEYSQIAQVGGGGLTRSFIRPKGELSTAWKLSPRTDVNFKLARRVGQLNFFDFLASVNIRDDIQTAANPDLVPQQSWEADLEGVRNLGKHGTTTLRLYGRLIDDIIDYIPIGPNGQAPGNLDSATVYGIESRSTFNLDTLGWKGARVDAHARLQQSAVEDPLTGVEREISNSLLRQGSLSLRNDIPASNWAWGGGLSYQLNALSYRLTEVGRQWEGPYWGDLYVENKDIYGLTVRAGIANALGARSLWDRTVYAGRRTGPVDYVEERDRRIGPIFTFSVRGKF